MHGKEKFKMGDNGNEKLFAIEACSCPRVSRESLVAPLCVSEFYTGGNTGVLFVRSPQGLSCDSLNHFGTGHYCTCKNRLHVYRKFGI